MSNQPAPKSAEEVFNAVFKGVDKCYHFPQLKQLVMLCMGEVAPRYVTDEEIDAMFPYLLVGSVREQTKWNEMQEMRRIGAKAMRDKIFSHRSA